MRKPLAALVVIGSLLLLGAGTASAVPSAANATVDWSTGSLGAHTVAINPTSAGGTVDWATVAGSDGAVGAGVQSNSSRNISLAPNSGVVAFAEFNGPVTDPIILVSGIDPGSSFNFGTSVTLLDSNNVTFNSGTGLLTGAAGATGSPDDGFAVRVSGTFGNNDFGSPGQASLHFNFASSSSAASAAMTVAAVAPSAQDVNALTVGTTPVTVSPNVSVVSPRTIDVSQTRLIDASGNAVTNLTNSDGSYAVDTTDGDITFTPAEGVSGPTTPVTYRVQDDQGIQATASITVDVTPDAGAPLANPLIGGAALAGLIPIGFVLYRRRRSASA